MRLDKFIAEQTGLTRSQAAKALKSGVVSVNEEIEKSAHGKFLLKMPFVMKANFWYGSKVGNILCFINHKAMFAHMMMANIQRFSNFSTTR